MLQMTLVHKLMQASSSLFKPQSYFTSTESKKVEQVCYILLKYEIVSVVLQLYQTSADLNILQKVYCLV